MRRHKIAVGLAVFVVLLLQNMAFAVTVGNTPITLADFTAKYAGGVFEKFVQSPDSFNFSQPGITQMGDGSYDGTTHVLTISNVYSPTHVKHVWFHMNYTPGHELPQQPGDIIDLSKWPTLDASGTINITGASVISGNDIYMTWDIIPQPATESIDLNFPALQGDFGGIYSIQAATTCTPEPSTYLLLGVGVIGIVGYGLRSRFAQYA